MGDSLQLKAGSGSIKYEWNNGMTTEQVTARDKGSYSVKATTEQGCISYDTLRVPEFYANPIVTLDSNPK